MNSSFRTEFLVLGAEYSVILWKYQKNEEINRLKINSKYVTDIEIDYNDEFVFAIDGFGLNIIDIREKSNILLVKTIETAGMSTSSSFKYLALRQFDNQYILVGDSLKGNLELILLQDFLIAEHNN